MDQSLRGRWALILGASSGFGAATTRALAAEGMNILGVHLDTRATWSRVEALQADVAAAGVKLHLFNTNAADARRRERVIGQIKDILRDDPHGSIHFVLHSLAFGSLQPFVPPDPQAALSEEQMEMTLRVMAHSLVYWVRDLFYADLLRRGSRVYALSSLGSQRATLNYGAVSAAKAALEAHSRQLAYELAPHGISVNCLMPGVTDTPALRAIPDHARILEAVQAFHPAKRLTRPEDVAQLLVALADPRVTWLSGAVIPIDGGESITGIG